MPINDARMEIRLPVPMREQVAERAGARGWTAAQYAREAIRLALKDNPNDDPRPPGKE